MKTTMKVSLSLFLFPSILIVSLLSGCQQNHDDGGHHEAMLKLEITNPVRKNSFITSEYVGQIHAIRRVEIRAMERGYLDKIFVDEGQLVRKGQPMFQLRQNYALAELSKATAEADALGIEYENTRALANQNIVSPNELALAKALLDKANAEVTMAETLLAWTKIDAPFTGFVDRFHVRSGSLMEEGEEMTTLSDVSKMWVYFNVHEAEYLDYVSGKTKQSSIKVQLKMANGEIYEHPGIIETIVADFDNKTGNIEFRATFPNPDNMLRHGQTGNILMPTPYSNAIIIPQKATFEVLDKTYVYVVDGEGVLKQRLITLAAELPHVYIVKDGLSDQDRILIEGLRKVSKGMKIEPLFRSSTQVLAGLDLYAE